jgi:glycerol-3-phosphate dehydrogenase subunit C
VPEDAVAIRFQPTGGVSYDPNDELYWSPEALRKELLRSFELRHSCRMCFKYYQSFPSLFSAIDANGGDVRKVAPAAVRQLVGECFQCKLCYTQCPYTVAEGHEFALDFPHLMLRA